ncbi:hypothetical protein Pla108_25470 [Botrimarina colliarenosi]|uniref:DUF4469 domain-containing protein n=1 Tax=Botrimarina colliarenosi TaxID=2528001 RepID=A0A5C6AEX1_9BACT|nr:hypothetical protein [Botrimarina colliarenosi]TWT96773.1 hypothetical protein Pla108_25470 [Botrimarina colliarenosi]
MNLSTEAYGAVFAGGSVVLFARVAYSDESLVAPGDLSTAVYSVEEIDPCGVVDPVPVTGHTNVAVSPASLLSVGLETGSPWDVDEEGFNFRHEIDITAAPAFATAGKSYRIRFVLTPTAGQPIVVRFLIEAL